MENQSLQDKILVQDKLLQDDTLLEKDQAQDRFESLLNQVPADPCIPEAIACLEEMAGKAGVGLLEVNYKKPSAEKTVESEDYDLEDLQVQVRGNYQNIKIFIGLIEEESSRIYVLSSSRLQVPSQASTGEVTLDPASCSVNDHADMRAEINIEIIYDHICMPGVEGEMEIHGAGSTNPLGP